jgi:serine/threonine-protein kinase RsbW
MNSSKSLRIAAELGNLGRVRAFVEATAAALGAAPDEIGDVVLATDEAVTNVIVHGYRGRRGTIDLTAGRDKAGVFVRLHDDAPPFDPTAVPEPDIEAPLEDRLPGGLGIYLIRQVMDEVVHRALPGGGNELILWRKLHKEAKSHGDDGFAR